MFMFATICNKLDMHEPLIQNIFVCINTQDMSAEITVYMTFPARYQLYKLFNISIKTCLNAHALVAMLS